jgi:hypothetical protein
METWRHGWQVSWYGDLATWRGLVGDEHDFDHEEDPFPIAYNNPVCFHIYLPWEEGQPSTSAVLITLFVSTPGECLKIQSRSTLSQVFDDDHDGAKFCYLVDLGEDLISVFMRNANEPPRVFKLDWLMTMEWVGMKDIGGAALFVDCRASFGGMSLEAGNVNRIYFPSYSGDGKHAAFYDMETEVYQPTLYGVKEPLNYV